MSGRLSILATTATAAIVVLSTVGPKPRPSFVWNVSASVPTGLYAVAPARKLAVTDLVVAMPPEHPWEKEKRLSPERLAEGELLLLGQGHCFRDQVLQMCPDCNRSANFSGLQRTLEGGSLETIRHMVASGLGVTVLPCSSVEQNFDRGRLIYRHFSEPPPTRRVILAWRKSYPRIEAIEALRQAVLAIQHPCLQSLPDAEIREFNPQST